MNAFEACGIYTGIKCHFGDGSYDYTKYGPVKLSLSKFYARNDQYYFKKFSHKYGKDVEGACIATFKEKPNAWIKDLLDDEAHERYLLWQKNIDSLSRVFAEDLDKIQNHLDKNDKKFSDLFVCKDFQHPILLKLLLQKVITTETFVILDFLLHFIPKFDEKMPYDPIWRGLSVRYTKYQKLLRLHQQKTNLSKTLTTHFAAPTDG